MNPVNTEKKTVSKMIKDTAIVLTISLASIFSMTASAQAAKTIETAISEFVVAQGQQVMNKLNEQLQQSLANEVKEFTFKIPAAKVEQQVSEIAANTSSTSSTSVQKSAQNESNNR